MKKDFGIIKISVNDLIPYARNARTHSNEQVLQIADYLIYSTGQIYSITGKKFLAQSNDKNGYKLVTMKKLGINKNGQYRAHRVIALAFLGKCPDGYQVNHKDGNKANNRLENLEYVTCRENIIHARDMGLSKIGKEHHLTKPIMLKKGMVEKIVYGAMEMAKLGFHPQSVHRVARGERKSINGWSAFYV